MRSLALAANSMFQVAYVVPNLSVGIEHCTRIFGVEQFLTFRNIAFEQHIVRGQISSARQNVAFGFFGATNIELIEPVEGKSIYSEFLTTSPNGGFHHIGYKVDDFEAAREEMVSDFEELQSGRFGVGTLFAYFDTLSIFGHVTELLFFDKDTDALFDRLKAGEFPPDA